MAPANVAHLTAERPLHTDYLSQIWPLLNELLQDRLLVEHRRKEATSLSKMLPGATRTQGWSFLLPVINSLHTTGPIALTMK